MSTQSKVWVAAAAAVLALAVGFYALRPSSFDDCVLNALKGGGSADKDAVAVITAACRAKFPLERQDTTQMSNLDAMELALLTGRASLELGNTYGGSLYNGNRNMTVTEVEVTVHAISGRDTVSRPYLTSVYIPPLSAAAFSVDIISGGQGATYQWTISGARGYTEKVAHAAPPTTASQRRPTYEPPTRTSSQDSMMTEVLAQRRPCTTASGNPGVQWPDSHSVQWTSELDPKTRRPFAMWWGPCKAR